jgi:hypothetical protein
MGPPFEKRVDDSESGETALEAGKQVEVAEEAGAGPPPETLEVGRAVDAVGVVEEAVVAGSGDPRRGEKGSGDEGRHQERREFPGASGGGDGHGDLLSL